MSASPQKTFEFFAAILWRWPLMALAFAVCTLVSIPPWIDFFSTGLGEHWDTRLMGQWLAWNAHTISEGRFLLPDFNANFFYPHANTLAFSEALWPQSFIYAALSALGANHFQSFNGTMLVFWAISGLCMYALLRHFQVSRPLSFLAGMIFCLMPYRLAYYIEFNMTLVFCVPLVWLAYFRWMQSPNLVNTLFVAACYWLSLTSCVYYTLIALLPILLIFIAEVSQHPERLRQRPFLLWLLLVLALLAIESVIFFEPYLELSASDYVRDASDHALHYLQALHYVNPQSPLIDYSALGLEIKKRPVRLSEVLAFPGSVLVMLALLYFFDSLNPRFRDTPGGGRVAINASVRWLRSAAWAVFWIAILTFWLSDIRPGEHGGRWTYWSAIIILLASVWLLFFRGSLATRSPQQQNIARLGCTAVICFFITLGPNFTLGHDDRSTLLSVNPLAWAFDSIALFDALRALSRFSIVVLCFLILAGVFTLHKALKSRRVTALVVTLLVSILVYEGRQGFYIFKDESDNLASPSSQAINDIAADIPLVQFPLGVRDSDAEAVLMTVSVLRPLVNGHSGFAPEYYLEWSESMRQWKIEQTAKHLMEIWPTPWLILNHKAINYLSKGWRAEFPTDIIERHWQLTIEDDYRSLYRPKEKILRSTSVNKWLRRDVLAEHPNISFEANVETAAAYRILINDVEVLKAPLEPGWRRYGTKLATGTPLSGSVIGDQVTLELEGATRWQVRDIQFAKFDSPAD